MSVAGVEEENTAIYISKICFGGNPLLDYKTLS